MIKNKLISMAWSSASFMKLELSLNINFLNHSIYLNATITIILKKEKENTFAEL